MKIVAWLGIGGSVVDSKQNSGNSTFAGDRQCAMAEVKKSPFRAAWNNSDKTLYLRDFYGQKTEKLQEFLSDALRHTFAK